MDGVGASPILVDADAQLWDYVSEVSEAQRSVRLWLQLAIQAQLLL